MILVLTVSSGLNGIESLTPFSLLVPAIFFAARLSAFDFGGKMALTALVALSFPLLKSSVFLASNESLSPGGAFLRMARLSFSRLSLLRLSFSFAKLTWGKASSASSALLFFLPFFSGLFLTGAGSVTALGFAAPTLASFFSSFSSSPSSLSFLITGEEISTSDFLSTICVSSVSAPIHKLSGCSLLFTFTESSVPIPT
ncbi:hypothetical protein D3C86_1375940 [compost metagenome]